MQFPASMLSLEQTLEAGLAELTSHDSPALRAPESLEGLYAQAKTHCLRGEVESLKELIARTSHISKMTPDWIFITAAMSLRLQIRNRIFDLALLKVATNLANEASRWQGELEMLLANYFNVQENHAKAREYYIRAAESFTRQGCLRIALIAKADATACDDREVDPTTSWRWGGPKLSPLEQRLVHYLSLEPRNRVAILEHLYGAEVGFEIRVNRFKSLVGGLRRKIPGVVLCEDSLYRIAHDILLAARPNQVSSAG